jgi:tetratricopeptide (TPR) repeat protein
METRGRGRGDAVIERRTVVRGAGQAVPGRFERKLALAILGAAFLVASFVAVMPSFARADDEPIGWTNRNYFGRMTDGFTRELLANAERNHLAQENFWKKYRDGELNYALDDLEYVLLVFPNHPKALHLLTMVCRTMKDQSTPVIYFEKAVRSFPNEPYTYAQYGAYLISTGDTEAGISRLRDALRIDPNLTYALGLLAEAQKKEKLKSAVPPVVAPGTTTTQGSTPSASASPSSSGTPSTSHSGTTVR